jgi:hypothetical protein
LKFKAEYEKNQLDMENMEKALENERANAREVSERTAEKAREVEKLRVTRNTDEVCCAVIFMPFADLFSFTAREGGEAYGAEQGQADRPLLDAKVLVSSGIPRYAHHLFL